MEIFVVLADLLRGGSYGYPASPFFFQINIRPSQPACIPHSRRLQIPAWPGDYANDIVNDLHHLAPLLHHLIPAVE
jgi:hypothetical protein